MRSLLPLVETEKCSVFLCEWVGKCVWDLCKIYTYIHNANKEKQRLDYVNVTGTSSCLYSSVVLSHCSFKLLSINNMHSVSIWKICRAQQHAFLKVAGYIDSQIRFCCLRCCLFLVVCQYVVSSLGRLFHLVLSAWFFHENLSWRPLTHTLTTASRLPQLRKPLCWLSSAIHIQQDHEK